MSEKSKKIIYWILTSLIAFIFIGSAMGKLISSEETLAMASNIGLNGQIYTILGVLELVFVILFVFPRTGILGTLMLIAYMGGAIATHLEHGQSILVPCVIQAFLWVVAVYRFPELTSRISDKA
ncbi:MAG: DoxX family protein [Flavobacteriales bacterium]